MRKNLTQKVNARDIAGELRKKGGLRVDWCTHMLRKFDGNGALMSWIS